MSTDNERFSFLLEEISDEELQSLENPTFREQENCWKNILENLTDEKINAMLLSIGYTLISRSYFSETKGVINRIFILNVKSTTTMNESAKQMILRLNNPHPFWKSRRNRCEVAVMQFVKRSTNKIPVPSIYSWSSDVKASPLGCEYILMEKLPGVNLEQFIEEKNSVPDHLVERMFEISTDLRNLMMINNNNEERRAAGVVIGSFDENMKVTDLVFDGPVIPVCSSFRQLLEKCFEFSIKEARKFRKYKSLASRLEEFSKLLDSFLSSDEAAEINDLNFNDELVLKHGDLNCSNILIDPVTCELTGVLDWEFASFNFDDKAYDYMKGWFDEDKERNDWLEKRVNKLLLQKKNSESVPQERRIRRVLLDIAENANQLGFFSSSWFSSDKNPDLRVRIHINYHAKKLSDQLDQYKTIEDLKALL